jgi:hypothetical protein
MGNNNINTTNTEDVYEEETTSEPIQSPRIEEIEDEEMAKRGAYGGRSPRIDEIEDEEMAKCESTQTTRVGANGGATPIMDKIHINSSIEDRIRILRSEMIKRELETEDSLKRLRSYEKRRNEYRCLMEELARYYDRQTALDLPIERLVLKTGLYMQHIMLH